MTTVSRVADDCFYCDKPIGTETRVAGEAQDAHRRCVDAKLDRLCPGWRDLATRGRGNGKSTAAHV
jgi:hypothetical protein